MKDEKKFSRFYETFLQLCVQKGMAPSAVAKSVGIASGAPTAWKNNGAVPKPAQRQKLCNFFGVTDEQLLGYEHTEKEPAAVSDRLSEEEIQFIKWYRTQASEKDKSIVRAIINADD